ncbi:2-oxo acid dehydrogenase subunit E2 [Microbacterium protaetiae]|uniref:Dihydrolipoamide acetyltransferase component of pyruvate dehydrogenase complex n=1 Tax=Microbacterium protaetiae TaxID=2509458 RepID=A0A4P6EGD5_9MICO|nr:dihydrolipoamide acetyltransferase family protein [Microbacterium protaetiae]QAY61500.1 2-oxo acid dehydrogenase subunit E2 [Microbacterium protaetiae]
MTQDFRLPDLGEGLPEAELVQWLVAEGDTVSLNQNIAEVETAKAVVELPSPFAGTVQKLHHAAGDTIDVGDVIVTFAVAGEAGDAAAAPAAPAAQEAAPAAQEGAAEPEEEKATPNLVGYGAAPRKNARPQRRTRMARADGVASTTDTAVLEAAPHDAIVEQPLERPIERPRSTPPVRKLAKDLGVDLALVEATGSTGLITRADVEAYAARIQVTSGTAELNERGRDAASVPAAAGDERVTRRPIRSVRKATAEAMVRSAFTAPHVTTFQTVDVTATMELVASLKADRSLEGHRIGVMAVAAKAVCLALGRNPSLNAKWDDAAGEIVEHHYVNLGVAAATDRGLIVPVIPDADAMTLTELADAIGDLAAVARSGKTPPSAMTGGTFSITNFGVFGVEAGTPILNPGEAGILGLGTVAHRPWEHDGEIVLRDVMTLSLSFDHRLVDGAEGSRFLVDVARVLEQPGRAMLLR